MSGARERIQHRLLRLEYGYDRLTEWRRLLVGTAAISALTLSLLYILGAASMAMVNRAEAADFVLVQDPTGGPDQVLSVPRGGLGGQRRATSTPTPAVEDVANLIQPPDVPEVAIIPPVSRFIEPVKPRVVAPTATPATVAASPVAAPPSRPGSPVPAPAGGQATATPMGTTPAAQRTPGGATATPTRPPGITPLVPQNQPTATPRPPATPTGTPPPR